MLIVVGPPGCWAREAGAVLAARMSVADSDQLLEDQLGGTMADLVLTGHPTRDETRQASLDALDSGADIVILGSAALGNREGDMAQVHARIDELRRSGAVKVFLDASPRVLMARCGMDVARPASLGAPRAMFLSQLKERTPAYARDAERIDTTDMTIEQIADALALRHSA